MSVRRFAHPQPQLVGVDAEHVKPQIPLEQTAEPLPKRGPEQWLPQKPQLLVSVLSLTQTPLQAVCPLGHLHNPLVHVPPEQVVPQPPQLLLSVNVFVQAPLQTVWPAEQHRPETHD